MRTRAFVLSRARIGILVSVAAMLAACAYGVDPDRSGVESGAGGAGSSVGSGGASNSSGTVTSSNASSSNASSVSASSATASSVSSSSASSASSSSSTGAGGAPPVGLRIQYKAADVLATNGEIKPHFNIVNGTTTSVPLAELTIRYYYSIEPNGSQTEVFHCDYALVGCSKVNGTFVPTTGAGTDHYMEVAFTGTDMLAPGQQSGEVQTRYNKSDYGAYDETNDYSFDPTKTALTDWDRVTLYQNGTLVWGVEP